MHTSLSSIWTGENSPKEGGSDCVLTECTSVFADVEEASFALLPQSMLAEAATEYVLLTPDLLGSLSAAPASVALSALSGGNPCSEYESASSSVFSNPKIFMNVADPLRTTFPIPSFTFSLNFCASLSVVIERLPSSDRFKRSDPTSGNVWDILSAGLCSP
mmetsp:Transcript_21489/g.53018  ORF Transcript_21489/g.53018 Transcript_21489/m.53018 type:complete len:161 (-) Transcript_21489:371-853(-)